MESSLEQAGPANQSFVQIPFSSTNDHLSTGFDASDSCQSILNYSIQTGEEFSLEFIRERANATKASGENASSNQNIGVCKVKNGIIGALQSDLENEIKVGLKSFAAIDGMRESESGKWEMSMTPSVSASDVNDRGISKKHACSVSSDHSAAIMRFFCSFGGKIMPRPSDGKLRYVGGATHIIRLCNDVSFQEFMQKTSSIYNNHHTIKYQLPGEDLDSLISVSCDEDLQNMMEEFNFLEVDGSQKLRMFLFASGDTDDLQFGLGGMESGSEMQYVAAVNGLEFEFDRGNSDHVLSKTAASVSGFDHLLNFGNEDGNAAMNRVEMVPIRVNAVPLRELMYPQISIYDPRPSLHSHQTHAEYAVGDDGFSQLAMLPMHTNGNQSNVDRNFSALSPSPSMYNRKNDNRQSEGNLVSLAISQSLLVENVEGLDIKKDVPKLPKHKSEGQFQSLENAPIFTNHQHGDSAKFEEESCSLSISGFVAPKLLSHKVLESEKKSPEFEVSNVKQFHNLHGDDHSCNCSSPCSSRAYQSEGISREPFRDASLSIFRSKSHDSIGSQFLIPNSHSNLVYEDPICESLNKLQFEESASLTQQSILLAKLECPSSLEMKNGVRKIENSLEIHDHSQMNTHLELVSDLNGKKYPHIFSDVDINEASTSQNRHNKSSEVTRTPCNLEDAESGNIEGQSTPISNSKIDVTNPSIETTFEHQCDSDSLLPYFNWADGYYFTNSKNIDYEPQLRDVLADINNRFPPGMVSGIFKARNDKDSSILDPLYKEKVALSVNMHNPDKKNWSYFQNLAQYQFHEDVSLIDQDHDDQYFPDTTNKEVSPQPYNSAPQKTEYFELDHDDDSQIDLGEVMQRGASGIEDDDDNPYHQGFLSPRIRIGMDGEGMQVENPFLKAGDNLRDPLPDDEEGKLNSRNADCPSVFVYGDCHLNNLQSIKNEDLVELKELGSGTFGTVYHGQWRGTDVAIKRIKKSCLTCHLSEQERLTMEFWREAEILSNLHHPNVLAFYGVVTDGLDSTLATITEFMVDGSLSNVLRNGRFLDYRKELIIAMDTAFGMEYLHSKNIVHFDLKCDNLLVNLKDPLRPICKVGDFGLSKIKQNTLVSGGVRGTLPWMAPELLSSSKVSEKVDVFSFGIVMWEILTGEEPYSNMHYGAVIGDILNNILRPPIPESCNPEWRMLMEQCWDADPIHRPSFTEIATHLRVMYAAHCDKLLHVKAAK